MFNLHDDNLMFRYVMTDKCKNFTFFYCVETAAAAGAVAFADALVVVNDVVVIFVFYALLIFLCTLQLNLH